MARRAPLSPEEYLGLRLGIALSFVGFVVAGVLVLNHLRYADAAFCTAGDWFSCNTVNRSEYSVFLGLPVALVGMLGFLAVGALSTARLVAPRGSLGRLAPPLLTAAVVAGLAFGAYLLLVELFVLQAVCTLCAAALGSFIGAALALRHTLVVPEALRRGRGRRGIPADGE